jgi:hypothetical protein
MDEQERTAERTRLTVEVRRIAGLHSNNGGGWEPLYAACVELGEHERARDAYLTSLEDWERDAHEYMGEDIHPRPEEVG